MRIVTWNCNNGNFSAKLTHIIEAFRPDIAVITEAIRPKETSQNVLWKSDYKLPGEPDSRTRGIAVYADKGFSLKPLVNRHLSRCVHGYRVSGPTTFNLLACWAHVEYRDNWVTGIRAYDRYLGGIPVIIAGDFNDNSVWDKDYTGDPTFEARMNELREKYKIVSAYHQFFGKKYGDEKKHPTYFQKRNEAWIPYHDDYILIPEAWMPRVARVSVGNRSEWLRLKSGDNRSDHMPVMVTLDI